MIYFVKASEIGLVKIGYTGGDLPDDRIAELQTGSPVRLELLATMPGERQVERELHVYFSHLRCGGEWFRLEADLAELLAGLKKLSTTTSSITASFWSAFKASGPASPAAIKMAFRRGYEDGFLAALAALNEAATLDEVRFHHNTVVFPWVFDPHGNDAPPQFGG